MSKTFAGWILFILLSLIWGSSFILMKLGLVALSAYQVASIRMTSAGLVLLPFAINAFKTIEKKKRPLVFVSGLLGSFFPAYLYCLAETRIDSSIAAIFNSLTPLFTLIIAAVFFKLPGAVKKLPAILLGLTGLLLMPFAAEKGIEFKDLSYSLFVLLATICYACNVNIVSRHLGGSGALNIASMAFCFLLLPAIFILVVTGFFNLPLTSEPHLKSVLAACVLGVIGTAVATIIFYMLVKNAGALFASLVTYGIPVVAVIWGLLYGEHVTIPEVGCLFIILAGVYLINRR